LLDGFPRTIGQAEALEAMLGDDGIKLCINLDVPIELVTQRLSSRRVCQECGTTYKDTDVEAISGTCSNCGGDVIQRTDDYPEAIRTRLMNYELDTEPLLKFYGSRGLLVTVDGDQSPDDVTNEIMKAVQERGLA
jgi:adenylate kinase